MKACGLAAGKGVIVAKSKQEAKNAATDMLKVIYCVLLGHMLLCNALFPLSRSYVMYHSLCQCHVRFISNNQDIVCYKWTIIVVVVLQTLTTYFSR